MAASPDSDSELMPPWFKFLTVYCGLMCCAFGIIGVTTRTSRGTNTAREEPRKCGALRSCFTWIWRGQEGRPCWLSLLIKCLTLTCASTASVAISLLVTNLSDSEDHSIAVTIKEILNEALGLDDNGGSRRRREVLCVKPYTGTSGVVETWEPCKDEDAGGWQVNIERGQATSCSILDWVQATMDSSVPPTCVILLGQVTMAAAVLVTASTISLLLCCSRKVTPRYPGREREAALEQGISIGRFAYMRPRTPEEMTRARFWQSYCSWMTPWILYPDEKESMEEITSDDTDKNTDVAETRVRGEEQLPQGNTSTSSKADACTQVTPTVRFEDEARIETCPEASSSQTPPGDEVTRDTTDQEMEVKKDTAKEQ